MKIFHTTTKYWEIWHGYKHNLVVEHAGEYSVKSAQITLQLFRTQLPSTLWRVASRCDVNLFTVWFSKSQCFSSTSVKTLFSKKKIFSNHVTLPKQIFKKPTKNNSRFTTKHFNNKFWNTFVWTSIRRKWMWFIKSERVWANLFYLTVNSSSRWINIHTETY